MRSLFKSIDSFPVDGVERDLWHTRHYIISKSIGPNALRELFPSALRVPEAATDHSD